MTWILLVGFFVGLLLTVVGGVWLFINIYTRPLLEAEVRMMEDHGKFHNEPEYIRTLRVARSGFELEASVRNRVIAAGLTAVGLLLVAISVGVWLYG